MARTAELSRSRHRGSTYKPQAQAPQRPRRGCACGRPRLCLAIVEMRRSARNRAADEAPRGASWCRASRTETRLPSMTELKEMLATHGWRVLEARWCHTPPSYRCSNRGIVAVVTAVADGHLTQREARRRISEWSRGRTAAQSPLHNELAPVLQARTLLVALASAATSPVAWTGSGHEVRVLYAAQSDARGRAIRPAHRLHPSRHARR
jgi:hypothetical protein